MADTPFAVQVAATHGHVPPEVLPRAEEMVRHVSRLAPAPVLFARVGIEHDEDPAVQRRVVVKATLDVNGRPVRAHVAAEHFGEALDLMQARLRRGLVILAERRLARREGTGEAGPGSWRHGDLPAARPAYYPRPVSERQVVCRKSYVLSAETVDEAALDLALLDHNWVLFTEATTGQDAVLQRARSGYRLLVAGNRHPDLSGATMPVQADGHAPTLTLPDAIQALELGGEPFVFFVDQDTGRGSVVYLRYDGHYGVVLPATPAVPAARQRARRVCPTAGQR